ncbi:hypothetical protein ILUMI_23965 [Ignelater luminosus]|uniref:Alpha 1,4-glycosyltransferase domain-containing protein n=1 Tax=Ignelater luminosus TaxID=2038154 RepID=A0A8K0CCW2_IGNLU|nr:hypothetical protein ILUMI_23965 [Ignelater luminosus]
MNWLNICTLITLRRIVFYIFLIITIVFLLLKLVAFEKQVQLPTKTNPVSCYRTKNETLPEFSDVNQEGKSIYFFDTSCASNEHGNIVISEQHACSVESAARANPNTDVYLLFTSPGIIKDEGNTPDKLLKALLTYPNVKIRYLNFEKYLHNTPVENLFKDGTIESSRFPVEHARDVLSYLTLWKYGGTYINFDVLVLKSLENLSPNYVGIPSTYTPITSVLNLSHKGRGRHIASLFLDNLKDQFLKHDLLNNGIAVLMRSLEKTCKANILTEEVLRACRKYKVYYSSEAFLSIAWWDYPKLFKTEHIDEILNMTKDSYTVQLWSYYDMHVFLGIEKSSNVPYKVLIEKYCPKVFAESQLL